MKPSSSLRIRSNTSIFESSLKELVPKLFNVIGIPAVLTFIGFFTIHSYLATVTGLSTYNVSITQYVAAGTSLLLFLGGGFIIQIGVPAIIVAIMIAISSYVLRWLYRFIKSKFPYINQISESISNSNLINWMERGLYLYQLVSIGLLLLMTSVLGFVYGASYYRSMPHMVGGGMPTDVILVFKDEQALKSSGLPIPINSSIPTQSEKVQLIIELTDGVLVRHETTSSPVIVKNDMIQAIIDAGQPSIRLGTATPTQTPTSTLTPVLTPTP